MHEEHRAFVLRQDEILTSLLKTRVLQLRKRLADGGVDVVSLLVEESDAVLSSGATREQLAAGVASMAIWLAGTGYDMEIDPVMAATIEAMADGIVSPRGGIRFPPHPTNG